MSLSEAIEVTKAMLSTIGLAGEKVTITRREVRAIERLLADATITLNQISAGVLRREGRSR